MPSYKKPLPDLYKINFIYSVDDSEKFNLDEELDYHPEYTLTRFVGSITDAIIDANSRVSQYLQDQTYTLPARVENNYVSLYLRKNYTTSSFEIASIYLNKNFTGKKYGTNLIKYIHHINSRFNNTLIQSVNNPYLRAWCKKNGWRHVISKDGNVTSSFSLPTTRKI